MKAKNCRQADWDERGGTSMPWTWMQCMKCYAVEGEDCKLPQPPEPIREEKTSESVLSRAIRLFQREKK